MNALITRARGLGARLVPPGALAEIERAPDVRTLAMALGRAGLAEDPSVDAVEAAAHGRIALDLATLFRWARRHPDAMSVIELDEDRRSLRTLVRGLAASVGSIRRRSACVPTSRLTTRLLTSLSEATSLGELAELLSDHPLRPALVPRAGTLDILAIEAALTMEFATFAREHAPDPAVHAYLAQLVDGENAGCALLLAARGRRITAKDMFVPGGTHLSAGVFEKAAAAPLDTARELLGDAFAGTPLARALRASSPAAVEDATLAWQLATQRGLRRSEPHGLAPVLYLVLRRRDEAQRLRRAAWRFALGGTR